MDPNRQGFHGLTDTVTQAEETGMRVTKSRRLRPYELTVVAEANTANGDIVVTLPGAADGALRFYSVHAKVANGKTVSVKTSDADASPTTIAADTCKVFYSTGLIWLDAGFTALSEA